MYQSSWSKGGRYATVNALVIIWLITASIVVKLFVNKKERVPVSSVVHGLIARLLMILEKINSNTR